jgi:hypothetical protein
MNLRTALIASATSLVVSTATAQTPNPVTMPSQLATATTIFLAYAGAPVGLSSQIAVPQLAYADVQNALLPAGRYTIATKPADAELSMRLSIEENLDLRLAIFDTKTGMLLWTIDEGVEGANRKETAIKNLNDAAVKLVNDLNMLAACPPPAASAPAPIKKRFSNEGKK